MKKCFVFLLLFAFLATPLHTALADDVVCECQQIETDIPVYIFSDEEGGVLAIAPLTEDVFVWAYAINNVGTTTNAHNALQNLSYTYDAVGNITQVKDLAGFGGHKTVNYTYDDLYRLLTASTTVPTNGGYNQTFTYDRIGNILTGPSGTYTYAETGFANPSAATQIGSSNLTYDNNGNVTDFGNDDHVWNYRDRLVSSTVGGTLTLYGYDFNNDRVTKGDGTTTTTYANKYYNTTTSTSTKHVFDNVGTLLATVEGNGTATSTNFIHADHLGSVTISTDEDGDVVESTDYLPYGSQRIHTSNSGFSEQRKYIGENYDTESSLSYLNARYYDGNRGQFMSQDPVFWGQQNLENPQSLNSYSYANGNPITGKDPLGLFNQKTGEVEKGDTLSGIASQINVANSTNYTVSELAHMNNISNPDKIYTGDYVGPTPGVPDITKSLTSTMKNNAKNIWSKTNPFYFRDKVQTGGDWDLKNTEQFSSQTYSHGFIFRGEKIRSDAPGNINYGYVGDEAYWSTPSLLHDYAGKNQIENGASNPEWIQNYGGDDPVDYGNIDYGIELHRM